MTVGEEEVGWESGINVKEQCGRSKAHEEDDVERKEQETACRGSG